MSNIDKQALREMAERAASDGWGYDRDEFNDAITPEVVLALLDELEKTQAQSSKWCEAFHKAVSVGARYEERIAELEARTVTVKLPADYRNSDGNINADMFNTCEVVGAFRDALAAAGIGVKGV